MNYMERGPGSNMPKPEDTPPEVIDALIKTMQGIAESKGMNIAPEKLRTGALLVAIGAEEAGEPLKLEEAQSPHMALMEKITKAVEART